jgi:hypothetical protein
VAGQQQQQRPAYFQAAADPAGAFEYTTREYSAALISPDASLDAVARSHVYGASFRC